MRTPEWQDIFPQLRKLPGSREDEIEKLLNNASEVSLPARTTVFHQGDECVNYILILEGSVRVMTRAENGREIVLYRLGAGDSCVLTTSCLFGNTRYPAAGITDTEIRALLIPASVFQRALQSSSAFREFVFASFSEHLGNLISLIEEVAFGRLDMRLAKHLLELSGADKVLHTTHQELATELGTAREVISRQLKDFEQQGWLTLQRGSITLLDTGALEALSAMHPD
jgi:CRP/FNR family transcriptional regulator, anaerobic regulatory protein